MKNDLVTSIGVAVVGVLISYFICNLIAGNFLVLQEQEIKTVDSSISTEINDPNPEVFNYKAIDPTVEVYVGDDNNQDNT